MTGLREIVFDTETTGLKPLDGDRIVEIGCVEIINLMPTGQTFHVYLNPQRDMPEGAFRVHGLSAEFLADKPLFADIAADFISFIGNSPLVAHNAMFDIGFINAEFARLGVDAVPVGRVVDTLVIARRKHPLGPNSLDALCQRYNIDNARRVRHGALLDAEILADVYVELRGGRQTDLGLTAALSATAALSETVATSQTGRRSVPPRSTPLAGRLDEATITAHRAFVAGLGGDPIWNDYLKTGCDG